VNPTAPRIVCPVLTCSGEMSADGINGFMCMACWAALPTYQRVAVETCMKAVRRQPTARNKKRLETAIANARRAAATVRS